MADEAWLRGAPARFHSALRRCASGDLPPMTTVMQLLIEAATPEEAEQVLLDAIERQERSTAVGRLSASLHLLRAHRRGHGVVKAVLSGVEHHAAAPPAQDAVAHWAAVFDRAARISPEGSVALYSLGEPALLRAATDEVVDRMEAWKLLGPDRTLIDLGCGIGRFEEALAPRVRQIIGLDISGEMIAIARERCAGLRNVRLEQFSGHDLATIADASIDGIVSVDVFPYLVHAGLAERHVAEAARVLKPGGTLLILNFSYRGDPQADASDVVHLAALSGFTVIRNGTREFSRWDGLTFLLSRRPGVPVTKS